MDTLLSQSAGNCCSISQAARGGGAERRPELRRRERRRSTSSAATARWPRINAIPGLSCRRRTGAFYLYVNCGGLIGKTTPDGKRLHEDGDV